MHSKFLSPSSAPNVLACAFFESGGGSAAADKGTELHRYHEALLLGKPYLLQNVDVDELKITLEDIEGVEWSARKIKAFSNGAPILVEDRLLINEEYDIFGTADAIVGDTVIDYKSGQVRDYSQQLTLYCLGLMRRNGSCVASYRIHYGAPEITQEGTVTREEAERLEAELILRRTAPDMFGRKANEGCSWCKNRNSCMAKLAESLGEKK